MADSHQSAAGVAEPPVAVVPQKSKPERRKKPRHQPRYNVILWNDDAHSFEYVVHMLQVLFGHPPEKGLQLAKEVDSQGRAIVLTTTLEHAELKRDQIHAFGKDDIRGCKGSMTASIEPVDG